MNYYYLNNNDIIKRGDEFSDPADDLGWWPCVSSVGETVQEGILDWLPNGIVRRTIKATKLGNIL